MTLTNAIELYRGFVNTWECDENAHMNVQFYSQRQELALMQLRSQLGVTRDLIRQQRWTLRSTSDHIRYLSERMAGDCVYSVGGIIEVGADTLRVFCEMRDANSHKPVAWITSSLSGYDLDRQMATALPDWLVENAGRLMIDRPSEAAPRSIPEVDGFTHTTAEQVQAAGFKLTNLGGLLPDQVDAHGWQSNRHFLGRISDGAGNLFAQIAGSRSKSVAAGRGGVALEQRLSYRHPIWPGEAITVMSAPVALHPKTQEYAHYMINSDTGAVVGTAHVCAAYFDLAARRISPPTPDELAALKAHLARP